MTPLQQAARNIILRWDSPLWKDQAHTAEYVNALRVALEAEQAQAVEPATGERAELIARHRSVQESGINAEMRELAKTTADMLEADAQEIVSDGVWEALQRLIENAASLGPASRDDALLVARWRGKFRSQSGNPKVAQQVAVPMTDAEIYAVAKLHPRIATLVPHYEVGQFARAIEQHHGIGAKP